MSRQLISKTVPSIVEFIALIKKQMNVRAENGIVVSENVTRVYTDNYVFVLTQK